MNARDYARELADFSPELLSKVLIEGRECTWTPDALDDEKLRPFSVFVSRCVSGLGETAAPYCRRATFVFGMAPPVSKAASVIIPANVPAAVA